MKAALLLFGLCLLTSIQGCSSTPTATCANKAAVPRVVEAACGQCLLDLKGKKGCDLAVRFNGKSYFVDGFKMKDLGDAHANDGMCNAVRKAKVTGDVIDGRFVATSFEMLPIEKK